MEVILFLYRLMELHTQLNRSISLTFVMRLQCAQEMAFVKMMDLVIVLKVGEAQIVAFVSLYDMLGLFFL
jgi:hypothetical protein